MTDQTEIVSNCCGAEILMADAEGYGTCADCKEHCGAEVEVEVVVSQESRKDNNGITK